VRGHLVVKVGTSKAGGTISQQAAVHPGLAVDAHGNKETILNVEYPQLFSTNSGYNWSHEISNSTVIK
jgi:hypothetical protein